MSSTPLRLLLIEDSFAIARELEATLRKTEGDALQWHHVETLGRGLKLLGTRGQEFDCVMVNLRLPDSEGLSTVRRLRAVALGPAMIVLAGPDERATAVEALRTGAQEVLVMPWLRTAEFPHDLQRMVRNAIARREVTVAAPAAEISDEDRANAFPRDEETAFALRFQPWAGVESKAIHGLEVMLGSRAAQATPREILSAAEARGELSSLSQWVLRRVAPQWVAWREKRMTPGRLAINVAASELQGRNFARSRLNLVAELGLAPGELQVELAEDALVRAEVQALGELQALREAGVRVVADNVGRSQVALLALGRLPLDGIKIDTSLIESIRNGDRVARAATRGLVALCQELDIGCCAVGVEVWPDFAACRELGVGFVQGYWICRPHPAEPMTNWLSACQPREAK